MEYSSKSMRYRSFLLAFVLTLLSLSLLMVGTVVAVQPTMPKNRIQRNAPNEIALRPPASDTLTLVVIGVSQNQAEEFLLIRFNPQYGQVPLTHLPKQTLVTLSGERMSLCEVYEKGSGQAVKTALSERLGIAVDRYVCLNTGSFLRIAEKTGTVIFTLPHPISYTRDGYPINLPAGERRLDGRDIVNLFAAPQLHEDEISRSTLLGELIAAIVNQNLDAAEKSTSFGLFKLAINLVDTDISFADFEIRRDSADFLSKLDTQVAGSLPVGGAWIGDAGYFELSEGYISILQQYFQALV